MRIARISVLVLGLVVGAFMYYWTYLEERVSAATWLESIAAVGVVGQAMAALWLAGSLLVILVPAVSVVAFLAAAVLAFVSTADVLSRPGPGRPPASGILGSGIARVGAPQLGRVARKAPPGTT
jgi:hypothetical protein